MQRRRQFLGKTRRGCIESMAGLNFLSNAAESSAARTRIIMPIRDTRVNKIGSDDVRQAVAVVTDGAKSWGDDRQAEGRAVACRENRLLMLSPGLAKHCANVNTHTRAVYSQCRKQRRSKWI